MTASALNEHPAGLHRPALEAIEEIREEPAVDGLRQHAAKRTLVRRAIVGAAVGAAVCAGVWMLLAVVALSGGSEALVRMLGVGAICGAFAGAFPDWIVANDAAVRRGRGRGAPHPAEVALRDLIDQGGQR